MPQYFEYDPSLPDDTRLFEYASGGLRFVFESNSGVFSHGRVDSGTDILLKALPTFKRGARLLDLGCGCGVVGIVLAKRFGADVTMSDVNPRALECAEKNLARNGVSAKTLLSDCFDGISEVFDAVILNPPVHAGKEVMFRMYAEAFDHLEPGGALYLVLLKKHGADSAATELTRLFGDVRTRYKKSGLCVFAACKNKQ